MNLHYYFSKKWLTLTCALLGVNATLQAQTYTTIGLSGFNADVIANGVGNASASTSTDIDGGGFAYLSNNFRATSTSSAPTYSLPVSGKFNSAVTGLTTLPFQLANYDASNSLRLNPGDSSTLTFLNPMKAQTVYALLIGGGGAVSNITFRVMFDDGTTQDFTGQTAPDWYGTLSGGNARSGVGRVNRTNNITEGSASTPRLFQRALSISTANQSKNITSIKVISGTGGKLNVFAISVRTPSGLACDVPTAITSSNITDLGATISWTANGTPASYEVAYGPYGASGFDPASVTPQAASATSTNIASLTPNTLYQVYVRQICGTPGSWAGPYNFTTLSPACNTTPTAGTVTAPATAYIGNNISLSLTGNTNTATTSGLTIQWQKSGTGLAGSWTDIASSNASSITNTFSASTYYRAYIVCGPTSQSDTTPAVFVLGYCKATYASTSANNRISNVTFGTINNTTSDNSANDFTNLSTTVEAGIANPISVITTGFIGFGIALDFNNDGDFADADEIIFNPVYNDASGTYTHNTNVTVPGHVPAGSYRMRVYAWGGNASANALPCWSGGSGTYGSFRDYTLNVTNNATCLPPSGVTISNVQAHNADAGWTASTSSPLNYEWKLMQGNNNPDSDPAALDGTASNSTTSINITGMNGSTSYKWYIRSVCGGGNSVWTNAASFTTPVSCAPPVSLTSSSITSNTATINWSAPATTTPESYDIYYSNANAAPDATTTLTATNSITGINGLSQTISGLTHGTTYYTWVRSNCGSVEGVSTWASVAAFTTPVSCYPVTGLDIGTITGSDVSFTWDAPVQGNPVVNYQYELRTSGGAGSGATGLVQSGFSSTTSRTFTGLATGTAYTLHIRTDCNAGDTSTWVSKTYTVPTYVPITITSYNEDVIAEGVAEAASTTTISVDDPNANNANFAYLSKTYRNPATPNTVPAYTLPANGRILNGQKYFQLAPYDQLNVTRLVTQNAFDTMKFFTPRSAKTVSILAVSGSGSSTVNFKVLFSDDTYADFTAQTVADWYGGSPIVLASVGRVSRTSNIAEGNTSGPNLYERILTLNATDTAKAITGIIVTKTSSSGFLNIFGVSIVPSAASCETPTALAVSNVSSGGADFTWTGNGANYQISYSTQGVAPANGTWTSLQSGTNYSFSGLNPGTAYAAYVRTICGAGDTSFWAGPATFTTSLVPCSGTPSPGAVNATTSDICVSGASTLSLSNNYSTNSGISYQWISSADGVSWYDIANATNSTYTANINASTYYRCRVICAAGPDTGYSGVKLITVHNLPSIIVSPQQAVACSGGQTALTASGGATYTWAPAATLDASTGATVNASPTAATTYTVTGADMYGCMNTASATISMITDVSPQAAATDICAPNTPTTIQVTAIPGAIEYLLTDPMGNTIAGWQSGNTFNVTPTQTGSNTYFVVARHTSCPATPSDTGTVTLNAGFAAQAVVMNASCANSDGSIAIINAQGPGTRYTNDFTSATLNGSEEVLYGNASVNGGRCVITPSATGNKGGFGIMNIGTPSESAVNINFNLTADQPINNWGTGGADAISYSYGPDAAYSTSLTTGAGSSLRVVFDAANNGNSNNNHAGVYITYGYTANTQMGDASAGVLASNNFTGWKTQTDKPVSIKITNAGLLTLTWNDSVIFSNVQLPADYLNADKSAWQHLFNAITGGDALRFAIDNLSIQYGSAIVYGKTGMNSNTPPTTWQTTNILHHLSGADSIDIWAAVAGNTANCYGKIGSYVITAPVMASLRGQSNPSCIGAEDGSVSLNVNAAGTYGVTLTKNGGTPYMISGLTSTNDGTLDYITVNLPQGVYTNIKAVSASNCLSNAFGPVSLVAPDANTIATVSANAAAMAQPGAGTQYYTDASCHLIATVTSPNNLGMVNASVTIGNPVSSASNAEPFAGRHYEITPDANAGLPATVKLYFTASDFDNYNNAPGVGTAQYPAILSDASNLRIKAFHGTAASGTTGPGGTYDAANADLLMPQSIVWNSTNNWWEVTVYSPNGFSGFFANTNTSMPLNIRLGNISAMNNGAENILKWDTKAEERGDYFNIERSKNGRNFTLTGSLQAKGMAPADYVYTDNKPLSGINYYRLQMVDKDGSKQYSKIVSAIADNDQGFALKVFPNPATSRLNIHIPAVSGPGTLEVTDITGRVLLTQKVTTAGNISLPMGHLTNGAYMVKYHDDAHTQVAKVHKN